MNQKEFLNILNKYRSGKASEEERRIIDEWYESLGQRRQDYLTDEKEEELKMEYWSSISDHISDVEVQNHRLTKGKASILKYWKFPIGLAASLVIALISWIYVSLNSVEKEPRQLSGNREVKWEKLTNTKSIPQLFLLADGSKVTLDPQSWIEIEPDYNTISRDLELEGKAFFEVAHDPKKPFIVNANGIYTRVLGTSFVIKSFKKDKDVEVEVKSGKVAVYRGNPAKQKRPEVVLTGNLKVVYDKTRKTVGKRIVDNPQPLTEHKELNRVRFEETRVGEIFLEIEKIYGVEIVFDEAVFSSCRLTTSIANEGLYDRLDIIMSAIGATYTTTENAVVISGKGCNQ